MHLQKDGVALRFGIAGGLAFASLASQSCLPGCTTALVSARRDFPSGCLINGKSGCEGCAQEGDTVANASGAGTLARRLVAGPRMDRLGGRRWRWNGTRITIGRWAAAFGPGGPASLIFEQTWGFPVPVPRSEAQQAVLKGAVQELHGAVGMGCANWNMRGWSTSLWRTGSASA